MFQERLHISAWGFANLLASTKQHFNMYEQKYSSPINNLSKLIQKLDFYLTNLLMQLHNKCNSLISQCAEGTQKITTCIM